MSTRDVLEMAMELKPEEKLLVVEGLLKSLDEPDTRLEDIWSEEAEKRLQAYRSGSLKGVPMDEIFG